MPADIRIIPWKYAKFGYRKLTASADMALVCDRIDEMQHNRRITEIQQSMCSHMVARMNLARDGYLAEPDQD